jgi:hypothetical protein
VCQPPNGLECLLSTSFNVCASPWRCHSDEEVWSSLRSRLQTLTAITAPYGAHTAQSPEPTRPREALVGLMPSITSSYEAKRRLAVGVLHPLVLSTWVLYLQSEGSPLKQYNRLGHSRRQNESIGRNTSVNALLSSKADNQAEPGRPQLALPSCIRSALCRQGG